jgi:uncharacterized membrane protein
MKKIKQFIVAAALVFGVGTVAVAQPTFAINAIEGACGSVSGNAVCDHKGDDVQPFLKTLINTLLFIIGILAVIVIIIGGIMYTLSAGDSSKVTRAKNMIIYALVGLVIAFLAYAIVNFVLKQLS